MNLSSSVAVLLGCLCAAPPLRAEPTPSPALLALAKRDSTLAIVDPASLKVIAKVPVGPDPHEVIASTDGRFAYVSNYGGGAYHTLAVVDLAAQRALPAVDLGALRGPHGLAFVGGKVWFTAEAAKAIGSYDPALQKIDWILGTGQNRTHMIYVAEDLKWIVTTNVSSATVSFIEKVSGRGFRPGPGGPPQGPGGGPPPGGPGGPGGPRGPGGPMGPPGGDWDETVVPVGRGSEGFDVSPDRKEIWVANAQDGTLSVIDTIGKKVSQTVAAHVVGANRLKFTPDGKLVFVSCLRGEELSIFSAATQKEVKRVKLGHGSAGILMQPDGLRAYVASSPDDYITAIDLKSLEPVGRIEPGHEPDGLAWAVRR